MRETSYGRICMQAGMPAIVFTNKGQETGLICLSGEGIVAVSGKSFTLKAGDALYVPKDLSVTISTTTALDLLECSAPVEGEYPLQFVSGESVCGDEKLHYVAGKDGCRRELNILLGPYIQAGKLLAGITRSLPGNWTSWPPHEHAEMLEEIYVFIDMPAPSFGLQLIYPGTITSADVEVVRDGDAILLPEGYHPNVAIPGFPLNFVWILAAHREVVDRKWGVVNVDTRYA